MTKNNPELGRQIHKHLVMKGVESPILFDKYNSTSAKEKVGIIQPLIQEALETLGFDLTNDSVKDTPKRVAKMWVEEIMTGLDYDNFPKVMTFANTFKTEDMVVERNMKSMSLCSHHLVTIDGKAWVAYIPKDKVIGLSKINRVVDFFSRRPQEAERLALQIYHALEYILGTDDIAVYLQGTHYCVKSRGINDADSDTVTAKMGGRFFSDARARAEFYSIVQSGLVQGSR